MCNYNRFFFLSNSGGFFCRLFCWKDWGNRYIYTILYLSVYMKKAFTLIEMVIVLLVIGVLMTATMRFGSGRIVDLKAQSLKEQFVGRYNDLYNQNMTSSFRDGTKYQQLTIGFGSGTWYQTDQGTPIFDSKLNGLVFRSFVIDEDETSSVNLSFAPYVIGCSFEWSLFSFQVFVPENGKQYCFEIPSETCKLIETRCAE